MQCILLQTFEHCSPTGQKQREETEEVDNGDWWGAPINWCNNMTKHSKSDGDHQKHQQAAAELHNLQFHYLKWMENYCLLFQTIIIVL